MPQPSMSLQDLRVGQRLRGVVPAQIITVLSTQVLDADTYEITYRNQCGHRDTRVVTGAGTEHFHLIDPHN